jgi:cytochrome P450
VFRSVQGRILEQRDPEVADRLKSKGWLVPSTLLLTDPPDHTRYRRLAQEALNPRMVQQMLPHILGRAQSLLDAFPREGTVDFVADFSKKLPIWVIGRWVFGAPESDFERINTWAEQFFLTLMPAAPREEYLRTVDAIIAMQHFIKARIDAFRAAPDDGILLSRLLTVHERTGDAALSIEELLSFMQVLLVAGHDTTRQTIGNAAFELARHPELQDRLRRDPTQIPLFINEILRLYAAANVTPRIARCDADIGGVPVPAGSMIFMAWGSANRDDRVHPDPDRLDIDRPDARNHLSFGWGIHHCVGAHLARAQIQVTLEELLKRFSTIRLAVDESALEFAPNMNSRGLVTLPLAVRAA